MRQHSLDGAPPQLLCDLAILWFHVLFVNRYKVAAPAAFLKGKLEQIRDHGGVYEHTGAPEPARLAYLSSAPPVQNPSLSLLWQRTRTRSGSWPRSCPRTCS